MGKALSGELSCPCDRSCFYDPRCMLNTGWTVCVMVWLVIFFILYFFFFHITGSGRCVSRKGRILSEVMLGPQEEQL